MLTAQLLITAILFSFVHAELWIQFYYNDQATGGMYSNPVALTPSSLPGAAQARSMNVGVSHPGSLNTKTSAAPTLQYMDVVKSVDYNSPTLWTKSISKAPFGKATILKTNVNGTMLFSFTLSTVDVVSYNVAAIGDALPATEHIVLSYTAISYSTPGKIIGNYAQGPYTVNYDLLTGGLTAIA